MADNWPITGAQLGKALGYEPADADYELDDLESWAKTASERIDVKTGRNVEPRRHELPDGNLPETFVLSAIVAAKLWWWQEHNSGDNAPDVPAGVDLPRKVEAWLKGYPPGPGIG